MNLARRNRLIKAQLALTRFYVMNRLFNEPTLGARFRSCINALDGRIAAYSDETYPIPVRWTPSAMASLRQWQNAPRIRARAGITLKGRRTSMKVTKRIKIADRTPAAIMRRIRRGG